MSALNPVLYGNRLYGRTLYSANPDPVTTTLTMSDSVSSADALNDSVSKAMAEMIAITEEALKSVNKPLADTTIVTDAFMATLAHLFTETVTPTDDTITTTGTKALPDSVTISEAFVSTFVKILSDSVNLMDSDQESVTRIIDDALSVQDSVITVTITKALNDILLLQDWLSLRLMKPNTWTVNVPMVPSSTLYGRVLFGRKLYSGQGGTSVPWNTQRVTQPGSGWKSFNQLEEQD